MNGYAAIPKEQVPEDVRQRAATLRQNYIKVPKEQVPPEIRARAQQLRTVPKEQVPEDVRARAEALRMHKPAAPVVQQPEQPFRPVEKIKAAVPKIKQTINAVKGFFQEDEYLTAARTEFEKATETYGEEKALQMLKAGQLPAYVRWKKIQRNDIEQAKDRLKVLGETAVEAVKTAPKQIPEVLANVLSGALWGWKYPVKLAEKGGFKGNIYAPAAKIGGGLLRTAMLMTAAAPLGAMTAAHIPFAEDVISAAAEKSPLLGRVAERAIQAIPSGGIFWATDRTGSETAKYLNKEKKATWKNLIKSGGDIALAGGEGAAIATANIIPYASVRIPTAVLTRGAVEKVEHGIDKDLPASSYVKMGIQALIATRTGTALTGQDQGVQSKQLQKIAAQFLPPKFYALPTETQNVFLAKAAENLETMPPSKAMPKAIKDLGIDLLEVDTGIPEVAQNIQNTAQEISKVEPMPDLITNEDYAAEIAQGQAAETLAPQEAYDPNLYEFERMYEDVPQKIVEPAQAARINRLKNLVTNTEAVGAPPQEPEPYDPNLYEIVKQPKAGAGEAPPEYLAKRISVNNPQETGETERLKDLETFGEQEQTKADVPEASLPEDTEIKGVKQEIKAGGKRFFNRLKQTRKTFIELSDPLSKVNTRNQDILFKHIGKFREDVDDFYRQGEELYRQLEKRGDLKNLQWANKFERGKTDLMDKEELALAEHYSKFGKDMYELATQHRNVKHLPDWLTHVYKKTTGLDIPVPKSAQEIQRLKGSFEFKRIYSDQQEAINAGLKPVLNPEAAARIKFFEAKRFNSTQNMFKEFQAEGQMGYYTSKHVPEGFAKIKEPIAKVYFGGRERIQKFENLYAEEGLARVINNHLSTDYAGKTFAGKSWKQITKELNLLNLSVSAFHFNNTSLHAAGVQLGEAVGDTSFGIRKMFSDPAKSMRAFSRAAKGFSTLSAAGPTRFVHG